MASLASRDGRHVGCACRCLPCFVTSSISQVYYFTKGNLKTANKQFSAVKNDYEITFTNDTSVVPCEDAQHLPSVQFDFVSIGDLENKSKDSIVGESGRQNI